MFGTLDSDTDMGKGPQETWEEPKAGQQHGMVGPDQPLWSGTPIFYSGVLQITSLTLDKLVSLSLSLMTIK